MSFPEIKRVDNFIRMDKPYPRSRGMFWFYLRDDVRKERKSRAKWAKAIVAKIGELTDLAYYIECDKSYELSFKRIHKELCEELLLVAEEDEK